MGLIDVDELRVPVGMVAPLSGLVIGLKAELLLLEQFADDGAADRVSARRQAAEPVTQDQIWVAISACGTSGIVGHGCQSAAAAEATLALSPLKALQRRRCCQDLNSPPVSGRLTKWYSPPAVIFQRRLQRFARMLFSGTADEGDALPGFGSKLSGNIGRRYKATAHPKVGGTPWTSKARLRW
jgi:hypothetical protein